MFKRSSNKLFTSRERYSLHCASSTYLLTPIFFKQINTRSFNLNSPGRSKLNDGSWQIAQTMTCSLVWILHNPLLASRQRFNVRENLVLYLKIVEFLDRLEHIFYVLLAHGNCVRLGL